MPKTEALRAAPHETARSALQVDLAQRIARLIKDGSLPAGQRLTADALAKQYGVSRTPIREALKHLAEQGFVDSRTNAGFRVASSGARLALNRLAPETMTEDRLFRSMVADRGRGSLAASFTDAEALARYAAPRSMLSRVLVRLTQAGLIERRRGHGWSFTESLEDKGAHDESYRFRAIVEWAGLREPTFAIDVDSLRRSREIQERFLEQSGGARAFAQFSEMNLDFHEMLARFSGNRFILRAVQQQNQVRRFLEYSYFDDRSVSLVESTREHLQIIEALEQGDRERAATLMMGHLGASSRR